MSANRLVDKLESEHNTVATVEQCHELCNAFGIDSEQTFYKQWSDAPSMQSINTAERSVLLSCHRQHLYARHTTDTPFALSLKGGVHFDSTEPHRSHDHASIYKLISSAQLFYGRVQQHLAAPSTAVVVRSTPVDRTATVPVRTLASLVVPSGFRTLTADSLLVLQNTIDIRSMAFASTWPWIQALGDRVADTLDTIRQSLDVIESDGADLHLLAVIPNIVQSSCATTQWSPRLVNEPYELYASRDPRLSAIHSLLYHALAPAFVHTVAGLATVTAEIASLRNRTTHLFPSVDFHMSKLCIQRNQLLHSVSVLERLRLLLEHVQIAVV